MPSHDQLAIVTGASSGMGRETARQLAERGYHVLAGVRRAADGEALASDHVEPVILDITDAGQIDAVVARVADDPAGRPLSVLVNNAGVALNAPIETLALDAWRAHFDVNFFGQVAVTRALLPALLAARGRIVNVSSIGGRVALPTYGPYAAAKFALEAYSDVLRREIERLGVRVIVIEPGTVATSIWGKQLDAFPELTAGWTAVEHERYDGLIAGVVAQARAAGEHGLAAADAARVIVGAITAPAPETRYLIGDAVEMARTADALSDRELDEMIAGSFG